MYIYKGFKYSEEEIKNAADKAGLSMEDYISKNEITFEKNEPQDFPTSTVEDADAVQQPMTASQAGFTESPSVDTPSESQDTEKLVDSFDENLLSAKTKLQEISLSKEEINAIKAKANAAPSVRGVGMGATTIEIYPYTDFIEEAKKEIATETKVDIYNIAEEDWRERAKNLYIKNEEKNLFDAKREEVLEDYEKTIYGDNPFSFARLKKFASKATVATPGLGLIPTEEELKYSAGRAVLTESFKEDKEKAISDYEKAISGINDYETLLNTGSVELNALRKKQADFPGQITQEDVERANTLIQNQKIAYNLYVDEFNKLENLETKAKTATELADLTKRTYNNLDVATNRIASAGTRMMAGLGSVAKELSISQIIKRTTGVDIRDEQGDLPVYLKNTKLGVYDKVFGSKEAEETVSNLYKLTKKIDEGTKERQELGKIKNIEDFGEFMLDLFSEQAVNTAVTVGLGGSGLFAVSAGAAGNKFNEIDLEVANDPKRKISPAQFYASGILFGAAEYLTEKVSLSQAKGALNYLGFGKKTFGKAFEISGKYSAEVISKSKALQNTFKSWGVNMAKEGSAEFSAQLLNNLTDINILNKEDIHWSDGLAESFISGSLMSGLGFNAPALVGGVANTFRTTSETDLYNKRGKEILRIRKEINAIQNNTGISDETSSQEAIKALQLELDGLVEQNILGIGVAAARVDELTSNDKRQLLDLDILINKSKRGIDKINNNTKLTNDAKDRLIEPLANNINLALKIKNTVLASSQNSAAKEKAKKIQIETAEKAGLDFNIINAKNKKEAIDKINELINESNIEGENLSALKDYVSALEKVEDNVNGQYFGAENGLPIALSLDENLIKNNMGATILHEVGHATVFKKLLEGNADILGLVADLESYAVKNYKGAKEKLKNVERIYTKEKFTAAEIAEEKMAAILEYVSKKDISKDLTLQGKLINKWNKIKPKGKNKEITSIQTGEDVFALINSFSKSFDKGELSGLAEKVIKGEVKARQIKEGEKKPEKSGKEAFSKSLELQEQLDNLDEFDFDNEVDFQTTKTNLETKIRLAKKKEAAKPVEDTKIKEKAKEDTKKNEKRIGDQIKAMVPIGTTNKEFKEKVAIKVIDDIDKGMLNPLIKKIAAGYGVVADNVYGKSWDDFFTEVAGVQLKKNIMDFNPESNDDLGGYIIGSQYGIRNRIKEALAKFKKEGEGGFKEDISVAKDITAREEAAPQEVEKRKYTPLTKSNIVPNFTITAITDKLTKVLSSLESKITAKRGDNAATTPLIAEIKKKIGKVVGDPEAAPKLVIQRLGKLKDGTYEKNLIKNKKAIIENMTTTFLMGKDSGKKVSGGIPQAIEKSVGGKFTGKKVTVNVGGKEIVQEEFAPNFVPYPEWVGQKIDREKTLVRGATAGNEIVRRVSADKVSDADFVGLFIDEKGKLIRGKREALGKALAEEIAFEILSKEIQNENSDISKAFEGNQEAQGEVLSDNFVNELTRDIDRGTVKFSLSTGDTRLDKARTNLGKYITSKYKFPNGLSNEQFYALVKTDDTLKELFDTLKNEYNRYLDRVKTDRMIELAVKFNASGNDNFNVFLNNYFDNKFSNISSALGVDPNSISRFKIKKETAKKTKNFLENYILDLINKNPKTAASTFILTLQSALASGNKQSLFGTNDNLYKFIESIKNDKIQEAFKNVKLVKSAGGQTFQINNNKVTTKFKQETSASDFNSLINDYINNVKVAERNKYASKAADAFLNFIDYLKDNKIDPEVTGLLLNSLGGSMRSSAKTLAKIKGAFIIEGLTAKGYTFEHGIPTNQLLVASALYIYNKNKNINKSFIKNIIDKSSIYIIPTKISDAIDSFYRNTFSNDKALSESNPEFYRYFSKNKYFQDYLKKKGISQFKESNITNLLDPKAPVKRNIKFSKALADFDPKGKVYKPSAKFSKTMNSTFNKMLERSTGIAADETISKVIARRKGVKKGKFKVFMPSSLDDFKGLTSYTFAGKGKQGEADQKFFQNNLIDPYFKGIRAIEETRQAFKDDFRALNKQMRPVIKKLGKLVPGTEFTHDQAIRVALWNASGYEIPGLSEIDQKKLVDYVNNNADLSEYARKLQQISKRPKWAKPGDFWDAETILSDLNNLTEKVGRKEFLSEFIENADIIFSEDNLNKVEAGYGKATRDALEDILYRMKNGTNRPSSTTDNTNRFNTWINNSIGAIMFFNRRSALLQTLSTVNFINWSDNNPLKAAAAFANQKQYWSDFATLFNSPKLKQRRSGLKSDVNEAEIARAVKGSKNKAVAALSYLLKIGFTPTQMADSFAIAAGGATFYRNRIKSYLKKVNEEGEALYTKKQAEEMAFKDFSQISEETQQSGDPALISSDQASIVGRVLLAFQNTPIQLNRSIKKAALDIKNRRRTPGQTLLQSDFSNLSKIIYYGTVQNIIFSALQNALFALIPGFEEEDNELTEEEQLEKYGKVYSTKQGRIINGMIDTTLKGGFGLPGAFISTIKNAYQEYDKQEKKKFMADHTYTILALANLSPSIGSKLRKVYSGIQTKKFEKDVIEERDWDITIDGKFNLSPSYKVLGALTEGFTNLPLDRAVTEVNALTEALDYRNTVWQRVALALGWRSWDVGAENEEHELIKTEAKAKRKEEGKEKAKATRARKKKEKEEEARKKRYTIK